MKFLDKCRIMLGKQPKIKKEKRWRYLQDGITKIEVEDENGKSE